MKKNFSFTFILTLSFVLLGTSKLFPQSYVSISGVVVDASNGAGLVGVSVSAKPVEDTTSATIGAITNDKGKFKIEKAIPNKEYRLEVKLIGYDKETKILKTSVEQNEVGEIKLTQAVAEGKEVEVTAKKEMVVIKADKKVYTVEGNPQYTATNVSELLNQTPSVAVDQDGNVTMRGNSVTIMMNDRPIMMPKEQLNKFLQSLPASEVKDIELKTNPSAKYDAKMQGGIINIVTKKKLSDMFGGNLGVGVTSNKGYNTNAGVYYNSKPLNVSLNGGLYVNPGGGSSTSTRINYTDSNERTIKGVSSSESESQSSHYSGQIDYNITENDVASVSFNMNRWPSEHNSKGGSDYYNSKGELVRQNIDTSFRTPNSNVIGGYNEASALLKHTFSEDHTLGLDWSYNGMNWGNAGTYISRSFIGTALDSLRSTNRINNSQQKTETHIISLNYENPITEKFKIELGAKNEMNIGDNLNEVSNKDIKTGEYKTDTIQSSHYLPDNSIYAGYMNLAYTMSELFSFQAGLRAEFATVSAKFADGREVISKRFDNYFPTASVNYNFIQSHSLSLSYRRSVSLPSVSSLDPTIKMWDNTNQYAGNPNLQPEFENSFELGYNTFWGMGNNISSSLFYTRSVGDINTSSRVSGNYIFSSDANFNGTDRYGIEASLMMRPSEWLNFRFGGNFYNHENRGSNIEGDSYSHAFGYDFNGFLSLNITSNLTLGSNFFYRSSTQLGGNLRSGYSWASINLTQRLFDKKLSISLRLSDPFDMQKWESKYSTPQLYTEYYSKWQSRNLGLNVSYRFGTTPKMEEHKKDKSSTKGGGGGGDNGGGGGN